MSKSKTEAGALLRDHLRSAGLTQTEFARRTDVSVTQVNYLTAGERQVSPTWADIIAEHCGLTPEERLRLHVAAAIDHGFKIDI